MSKVLVIEDEHHIRNIIVGILEAEGFEVMETSDGIMGLQLAQLSSPDLIVCDVMMPNINGYDVLNKLQENPKTQTIPFIFLTAKSTRNNLRYGMSLGADDYLTKPFTRDELLSAIMIRLKKKSVLQKQFQGQLQQLQEKLNYLLHYDSLTELPNRLLLQKKFHQLVTKIETEEKSGLFSETSCLPILYLNVDRFSRINNSFGCQSGDLLLKAIAERLDLTIDEHNHQEPYLIARLNNDEFVVILQPTASKQIALDFAQILIENLSHPFQINHQEIFMGVSIGITFYPRHGRQLEKLLQNAKKAMLRVKQQGGNQFQLYTPVFQFNSSNDLVLETDLRYALARGELDVYYQPQVNLHQGKIVGAEALLRWHHPKRGFVPPNKFIPIAEETGIIDVLGEWVLCTACCQSKTWQSLGFYLSRISVNLSGRQFNHLKLRQKLANMVMDQSLSPQYLELEFTESILVENEVVALKRLNALKALGVKIAIDDFGTGYSSFNYLQKFPFDILKIDRRFVHNLDKNSKNRAITTSIIDMAHQLNIKVVAEGVETVEELEILRQHHCDEIQGYLLGRPMNSMEFERLLKNGIEMPSLV